MCRGPRARWQHAYLTNVTGLPPASRFGPQHLLQQTVVTLVMTTGVTAGHDMHQQGVTRCDNKTV